MEVSTDPVPEQIVETRIPVEGMECAACALRLERQLSRSEGVVAASVNYATSEAAVSYDPTAESMDSLREIVEKTGFEVGRIDDESAGGLSTPDRSPVQLAFDRFLVAAVLSAPVLVLSMVPVFGSFPFRSLVLLILTTPVVIFAGRPIFVDAYKALRQRSANMNTLISLGVGSSYIYSIVATLAPGGLADSGLTVHVYFEAAAVIITLVLLGRLLEARAKSGTQDAIRQLVALQPDTTFRVDGETIVEVPLKSIRVGDLVLIKPGSRVSVDAEVVSGRSDVDESMLTGEPFPVTKGPTEEVVAGTMNGMGALTVRVTRVGTDTVLSRIVEIVRDAQGRKPPIQRLADKVAAIFVPTVLIIATISFIVWLMVGPAPAFTYAIVVFVSVLIIACPCALGLATPTAIVVGIGSAASKGVLMRGGDVLERLQDVDTIVVDKTGTLTEGTPQLVDIRVREGFDTNMVLRLAASLEVQSEHPIAKAVVDAAGEHGLALLPATDFEASVGGGVQGRVDGRRVTVGTPAYVESNTGALTDRTFFQDGKGRTAVVVAVDDGMAGVLDLNDRIRSTSKEAIETLKGLGLRVIMASGDQVAAAEAVAEQLGIEEVFAETSPEGKASLVEELRNAGSQVAVVGDGINDAPALAAASVGIAIGTGTDVAIETADVTLVRDDLRAVASAIKAARMTMKVIRQNLFFAFAYNVVGIPIAAGVLYPVAGLLLNPMIASAAMALSSVSVVSNSLRLKRRIGGDASE